ncbi:hypothetical protein BHE74_00035569 [Ensete ventricosum]|nr:hypothetical protein BHE74_00035569 [Ensete ventricosum]RZS11949.1 hypothetical protein BHM03_00043322 [Ensete ventricosum]
MKDLCLTSVSKGDEGYYALRMMDLPQCDLEAPLEARWSTLKQGTRVWVDGTASTEYARGSQHYYMALADRVHNVSRVISVMDNKVEGLRKEIVDLKAGSGP